MKPLAQHGFYQFIGYVNSHIRVDAATGQNHIGNIPNGLRAIGQIVGINANTMAADQTWSERQEVPLSARCLQDFFSIDTQAVKNNGELVDQRDIQIALRDLDNLSG